MADATHRRVLAAAAAAIAVAAVAVSASGGSEAQPATIGVLELSPAHRGDPNNAIVAACGDVPLVALTFDDGPLPGATPRVLAFLRREGVHATFFVIGRRVRDYPEIVRTELAAGHEVATHTWSHALLPGLPAHALHAEIADGARALQRVSGRPPLLFRPPHGYFDARVSAAVATAGLRMIGWDVAIDRAARGRSPRAAAEIVLRQIRPGSILLAHDLPRGGPRAIEILSIVLPRLRGRGLRVVTVSELLRAATGQPSAPLRRSSAAWRR